MTPATVTVRPASAPAYGVTVGSGVLAPALESALQPLRGARTATLVRDTGVPEVFAQRAVEALARLGMRTVRFDLTPSERVKTLTTLGELLVTMEQGRHERGAPLIALGGGVVGDVAGFAAAVYRRGVPLIQCPSTLLAMVDASVGGKTGVNLAVPGDGGEEVLKNAAGAFHQPIAVIADTALLASLDPRERRCGVAECLKHAMIAQDWGDPGLAGWIDAHREAILDAEPGIMQELVRRNVRIKAAVVGDDERETRADGGRALLNLGHTFGHAIEPIPHLSPTGSPGDAPLRHGEAVALGLVAATACAAAMGRVPPTLTEEVAQRVRGFGLPTALAGLPDDETLIARMGHDKKSVGGSLRLVLPASACRAEVVADPPRHAIAAGWAAIRS